MNRKNTILIAICVLLIAAGALASYFAYRSQKNAASAGDANSSGFSFGQSVNNSGGENPTATPAVLNSETGNTANETGTGAPASEISALAIVSKNDSGSIIPTTGGVEFEKNATTSALRYMERGTGHIFERDFSSSTPLGDAREISNTTIPRIVESIWTKDGSALYARYTPPDSDTITTYYGKLILATTTPDSGHIDGSFLTTGIDSLALGSKGKLFTIEDLDGRGAGIIENLDGTRPAQIFDSPLTEWLPQWPADGTITLTTKASADAPGFLYFLSSAGGTAKKMLAGMNGLTTLTNTDASYTLFSRTDASGRLETDILNTKTGETSLAPVRTLPEKCVWSKKDAGEVFCLVPQFVATGKYPDDWYQGTVFFSDEIWKINVVTGESHLLIGNADEHGAHFDGIRPFLDQKEATLFFTNKTDMAIWSLKISL